MKNVRKMEKADSLTVCIICGIRALQKERGGKKIDRYDPMDVAGKVSGVM
jgi:hypothetical protein